MVVCVQEAARTTRRDLDNHTFLIAKHWPFFICF